ncbi:rod-binding protein [soil metagenome]
MAIKPPSDIVLDVARAADPARRQAAVAKLGGSDNGNQFASYVGQIEPAGVSDLRTRLQSPLDGQKHTAEVPEAYRSFEAFFLQNFIQSMLPKSSEATYGSGTAGEVWRSFAAQEMGDTIAKGGGIGIADRLLAGQTPRLTTDSDDSQADAGFSLSSALSSAAPHQDWAATLPFMEGRVSPRDGGDV